MMLDLTETTFTWTVDNFDVAPHLTGESLESPMFSIDTKKNSQFSLVLHPRGSRQKAGNHISLFLKRHDDNVARIVLVFELCLINASGKYTNIHKSSRKEFDRNTSWGFHQFCRRSALQGFEKHDRFPSEKLTVRCRILPRKDGSKCADLDCLSSHLQVLSQDFGELLQSGIHSDLTIKAQTKRFNVHRAILEARCPKLMSKLVWTKRVNVKALPNIKAPALQAILNYIYTGIFESTENLDEVFEAANTYELADLKTLMFPYSYSSAKTVVECSRVSFEWIIPDFRNFSHSDKELSYLLISDNMPKSSWMKVSLLTKDYFKDEKVSTLMFQKLRSCFVVAVHFKIHVSDKNGELILLKESVNVFEDGKFELPFDIKSNSDKILENGNLKLHFDIRASVKNRQTRVQEVTLSNLQTNVLDANRKLRNLHEDLRSFHESMKTGDVTLNVGARKLAAHKAVLCSRSEVFRRMFEHDSRESRTNTVNIEDVNEETMASVLMYMYCGVTDEVTSMVQAIKIYAAADKYQLLPLKEKCCDFLKSNVDAANGSDVLRLADMHSDEGLKKCVYDFMAANASEILQRGLKALENKGDLHQDILNVLFRCASLSSSDEDTD